MSWDEVFKIVTGVIASLGSASVVIFGFSNWLGKVWASRLMATEKAKYAREIEELKGELTLNTEAYKMKLKKSEFLFQKEYEAASEFIALKQKLSPTVSRPNMDYYEVCDDVAREFARYTRRMSEFLAEHGAVLSENAKLLVQDILAITNYGQYEVAGYDDDVPGKTNKAADNLLQKMEDLEQALVNKVFDQSIV